jgi:hypothetical protein
MMEISRRVSAASPYNGGCEPRQCRVSSKWSMRAAPLPRHLVPRQPAEMRKYRTILKIREIQKI